MRRKIENLQKLYFVLFFGSLVLLVLRWTIAMPSISMLAWAVCLGGAVATRLYRQSLVTKYNAMIYRGPGPMA